MNKKTLISVCIFTIFILILSSLSPVIGYQSIKSSSIESPLYNIRTKKAINVETQDVIYNYIGKDKKNILLTSLQINDMARLQIVLDKISKMDDREFNKLICLVINYINLDENLRGVNVREVISVLHQLRDNPKLSKEYLSYHQNYFTMTQFNTICGNWVPGCFIEILYTVAIVITFILAFLIYIIATIYNQCPTPSAQYPPCGS